MVECLPLLQDFTDDMSKPRCGAGREETSKSSPTSNKSKKKKGSNLSNSEAKDSKKKELSKKSKYRKRAAAKGDQKEIVNGALHTKGLSPPGSAEAVEKYAPGHEAKAKQLPKEPSSKSGFFDKTQWERTRFAKEAAGLANKSEESGEKRIEVDEPKEVKLPGEARQITVVRGEYLNDKPKFIVTLLIVELVWCTVATLVWGAAAENPLMPQILAIFNMLAIFLLILICLSVEYFRYQVRREDTKSETKYFIPYSWRYALCECHVARAILLCANITIMAFDNDFDIGSVLVLAATPLHLIIASIHIFIAFKPKRQ